jgi:hypothetical protein
MKVRDLMSLWEKHADIEMTAREYTVRLPVHDAARIMALAEMYPAKTEGQIITELISAALYELEEAFPYARGERIISKDDYDDPVYEDAGPTSDFLHKTSKYQRQLESELKNSRGDSGGQ